MTKALESPLRVCSKITSDFGGSAAWPDARREEGASPSVGCDRRATKQMARRRPAPEGCGCLAVWRCCSLLTDRWRVCSSLAPSQTAKQPPAKSEFIFEQTLNRCIHLCGSRPDADCPSSAVLRSA